MISLIVSIGQRDQVVLLCNPISARHTCFIMILSHASRLQFRSAILPIVPELLCLDCSPQCARLSGSVQYSLDHWSLVRRIDVEGWPLVVPHHRGVYEDVATCQRHPSDRGTHAVRPYTGLTPPPSRPVKKRCILTVPSPHLTSLYS